MQTALPESVRRAAELSNQLQAKMKAGTLTFEDTQVTADQVQMPPPQPAMPKGFQPQPPGPGAPGLGTPGFNPQPAEAPASPPAAQAQPSPPAQPPAAPPPDDATAEHRYKVLQGKYNAEVPRLQKTTQEQARELEQLRMQLNSTQSLLATLGASQAQPPAPAQPAPPALVTDKDRTEFGEDLVDLMRRVAQETVQPKLSSLEERFRPVAETVQQMAPVVQQTAQNAGRTAQELAQEKFYNGLDEAVKDWERINAAPEFHAWLDQEDPYAGQKRGAMLAQAYGNGDVTRVAKFFTGFMNEHAAVAPTGQQPATPQPGKPLVSLSSLAAPGTGVGGPAAAGAPNEPGQPRGFTAAEVGAFYRDVHRGAFKGREAEKIQIERAIFAAQKAGQIRP